MSIEIADLVKALPVVESEEADTIDLRQLAEFPETLITRPIPVGTLRRLSLLGGLQAKVAVAYALHWIRGWFQNAASRDRDLAETHFRAAVKLLDSMGYLRGAAMKVGQTLANFPDIVPDQLVETLERLHFEAPPMHFSLLREMFINELGDEPEQLFAEFDEVAFAAASLGQVHRGRLKTGEEVAIKIQYPGIARTIRSDFKALVPLLLPSRLGQDWDNLKQQFEFLRRTIERETDYQQEAEWLTRAGRVFHEEDGIIVPRVFSQFSTRRVLTMEYLQGDHIDAYLARHPSQEDRNEFACKLSRSAARLLYQARLLHVDWHPGNFLFLPDGRLGLLDFGCVITYESSDIWQMLGRINRAITTGREEHIRAAMQEWASLEGPEREEQLRMFTEFGKWAWRPYHVEGPFNYGDAAYLREGLDLFAEMVRRRYTYCHPSNLLSFRWECGHKMMAYRLGAVFDPNPVMEEEVTVTGWDRSDLER